MNLVRAANTHVFNCPNTFVPETICGTLRNSFLPSIDHRHWASQYHTGQSNATIDS